MATLAIPALTHGGLPSSPRCDVVIGPCGEVLLRLVAVCQTPLEGSGPSGGERPGALDVMVRPGPRAS
jgi:hypothetical protein